MKPKDLDRMDASWLEEQRGYWLGELADALYQLSRPSSDQVRLTHPACVTCSIINDFDSAFRHVRGIESPEDTEKDRAELEALRKFLNIQPEQAHLLDQIDSVLADMQGPDCECGNIGTPVWQQLRELASQALLAFDWRDVVVEPYVEVSRDPKTGTSMWERCSPGRRKRIVTATEAAQ